MKCLAILVLLMTGVVVIHETDAYNVLFIAAVSAKSHTNFYKAIINELADSGHHVTLVTPFPSKRSKPNVREIASPAGDLHRMNANRFGSSLSAAMHVTDYIYPCADTLENDQVQSLMQEKFDAVFLPFLICDCYFPMIHQMQVPFILVSPSGMMPLLSNSIGNPRFPSFTTLPYLPHSHPLTFLQRTLNVLAELGSVTFFELIAKVLEWDCSSRGLCPDEIPSVLKIQQNVSLIFLNSVRQLEVPARPYVPNVIHIGGIHCRPAEALPQDLEEWIKGAGEQGFIFFSLGSVVNPSDLPEEDREVLVKVFGSLKQRILWKWDKESMPGLPPNVRLGKWLPQQDILGHPKLRLFITHGGMQSIFEAVYHGIPILGLPVFADQMPNMMEVDRQGWGKVILWDDLTEENLLDKINVVMADEKIHQAAQLQSTLMRDQPVPLRSLVTYWTEYAIRHRGARHLRCPIADMPWYKIYNMDVWGTLTIGTVLILWLFSRLIRAFIKCVRGKPKDKKD